ncbi:MAG: hypothetical protein QM765_36970 [Myxococcales bacterium]
MPMLFCVRVRLEMSRFAELGKKLATKELDRSSIRATYCLEEDPAVGISIWEAEDRQDLDRKLAPFLPFYEQVREVLPVVSAEEAQRRLIPRSG